MLVAASAPAGVSHAEQEGAMPGSGRGAAAVISAGGFHTCAVLENGTVRCWGGNDAGQLGYGDTDVRGDGADEMGDNLAPVDLGTGRTAIAIVGGGFHTSAVLDTGAVKCWGDNNSGQLGYGDFNDRGDGADEMGDNLAPIGLGTGRTAIAIAAGDIHTCALLDDDTVKCWGANAPGQLGQGDANGRGGGPVRWVTTSRRSTSVPVGPPLRSPPAGFIRVRYSMTAPSSVGREPLRGARLWRHRRAG